MTQAWTFGPWQVAAEPEDGGRLTRLAFDDVDLLTPAPTAFRPPAAEHGRYETRPVYGYDDCLPTVDACPYPRGDWKVPDHGELCWLRWTVTELCDGLEFAAVSHALPLLFRRRMRFGDGELEWLFSLRNDGDADLPFQHVMHPLMPLERVTDVTLPPCGEWFDEMSGSTVALPADRSIGGYLGAQPRGCARMLLLRRVTDGHMVIAFRQGLRVAVDFDAECFPSIGIWWNNGGYPDEEGSRRTECAFEPIPGNTSMLADAAARRHLPRGPGRPDDVVVGVLAHGT